MKTLLDRIHARLGDLWWYATAPVCIATAGKRNCERPPQCEWNCKRDLSFKVIVAAKPAMNALSASAKVAHAPRRHAAKMAYTVYDRTKC